MGSLNPCPFKYFIVKGVLLNLTASVKEVCAVFGNIHGHARVHEDPSSLLQQFHLGLGKQGLMIVSFAKSLLLRE